MERCPIEVDASAGTPADLEALFSSQSLPMRIDLPVPGASCRTHLRRITLDSVSVGLYEGEGTRIGRHDYGHLSASGSGFIQLVVPRSAAITLYQDGRRADLGPGTFALMTSERPFQAALGAEPGASRFSNVQVVVPVALLRARVPALDRHCAVRVTIRRGIGRLMIDHIDGILSHGADLSAVEGRHVQDALLDVIAGVLGSAPELAEGEPRRRTTSTSIVEQAKAFIESRLTHPGLTVQHVARHCHVSIRYLHAAFASTPASVAGYIRERRLLHARRALRDPALSTRPVAMIAYDWGFASGEHFSRTYRARFGVTPSGDRRAGPTESRSRTSSPARGGTRALRTPIAP